MITGYNIKSLIIVCTSAPENYFCMSTRAKWPNNSQATYLS
jgi:hypothetical protein